MSLTSWNWAIVVGCWKVGPSNAPCTDRKALLRLGFGFLLFKTRDRDQVSVYLSVCNYCRFLWDSHSLPDLWLARKIIFYWVGVFSVTRSPYNWNIFNFFSCGRFAKEHRCLVTCNKTIFIRTAFCPVVCRSKLEPRMKIFDRARFYFVDPRPFGFARLTVTPSKATAVSSSISRSGLRMFSAFVKAQLR